MTTIRELLEQKPEKIVKGIEYVCNHCFSHVPELDIDEYSPVVYDASFAPEIEAHVFHYQYWDPRRFQSLSGIKFRDQWIMLCYNAGRGGSDYSRREIINATAYREMVLYLKTECAKHHVVEGTEEVSLDKEVEFVFYHDNDVRLSPHFY